MKQYLKTSLMAIICAGLVADAYAAATVRSLGAKDGKNVYQSAAAASGIGANRAGSLRTGGLAHSGIKATVKTSSAATAVKTDGTSGVSVPGSVATGGAIGNRAASSPRLAIGKYIGSTKSFSGGSSGSGSGMNDVLERLERIENTVNNFGTTGGGSNGDSVINAKGNLTCDEEHPCALVSTDGTHFDWVQIAQPGD